MVATLDHMRYQIESGVRASDWDDESLEHLILEHIQLQEGHEAILALPDHPMLKPAKDAARHALGR